MQSTMNLLEGRTGPISQSVDAVKALLSWKGHPVNPLPADVTLDNGRLVLVLSNKKDVFYTVTPTKCSCPAATYHLGQPCKHQRKHFPQEQVAIVAESGSIRPECKWPGGLNGPVDECKGMA
jgi:SWIM zinc finger